MATKTYIRGFERYPIDTLRYAASTNFFLTCAEALADFGTYLDMVWVPYNQIIHTVIVYDDGTTPAGDALFNNLSTNNLFVSGSIYNSEYNSLYTTVNTNSAAWTLSGGGSTDLGQIPSLSGNWNSTYTTVNTNSASWGGGTVDLGEIPTLSGNWNSSYTTTNTNSANWNSTYTTVNANSAQWILSGTDVNLGQIPSLSGNWNSTYTTVNNTSGNWLSSNNVFSTGIFTASSYMPIEISGNTYYIRTYIKN